LAIPTLPWLGEFRAIALHLTARLPIGIRVRNGATHRRVPGDHHTLPVRDQSYPSFTFCEVFNGNDR